MLKVPRSSSRSRRVSIPAIRRAFKTWKRWPRSGWNGWRISAHPKCDLCSGAVRTGRRYPQRSFSPARLRNHDSPHRLWSICLVVQFLPESVQPPPLPLRFDVLEAFPIHTGCALIGFRQRPCAEQNVFPVHLIVELIEAESRLVLRLSIQLDLKFPNLIRHFQTFVNHRVFPSSQTCQKRGSFPPPALPGFTGTSDPLRRPDGPCPFPSTFAGRDPATIPGLPH